MVDRVPALQRFVDKMRDEMKSTGMTEEELSILDIGASHAYECECDVCRKYWELVGPEQ